MMAWTVWWSSHQPGSVRPLGRSWSPKDYLQPGPPGWSVAGSPPSLTPSTAKDPREPGTYVSGTTMTGRWAWWVSRVDTDPSNRRSTTVSPWLPTTMRSGPLLGSSQLQLGRRIAGTNLEPPGYVERVQRLGGPLAGQLFDRAKGLLGVTRHGHGGRRPRHRRYMADMHGRELGTEVRGEPSCDPGCLDAAVGAINTENDSVHCCTSPSSSQPPGA